MAELLCVGETMVSLVPTFGQLDSADYYSLGIAGAESNVATHAARLGRTARWISRLGDDAFGRRIISELSTRGVEVQVETDPVAPTGIMLKEPHAEGSRVQYYRQYSAASAMDAGFVSSDELRDVRIVHTTGVTPALSRSCGRMVDGLYTDAHSAGALVSFDVNDRRPLWPIMRAAATLGRLADAADICFVGRDEAERLWGTKTPAEIRERLPNVDLLVVKDGPVGATVFRAGLPPLFVPALSVEVVEPIGAGDAFAGGFLSGILEEEQLEQCIVAGHLAASRALSTPHDLPPVGSSA